MIAVFAPDAPIAVTSTPGSDNQDWFSNEEVSMKIRHCGIILSGFAATLDSFSVLDFSNLERGRLCPRRRPQRAALQINWRRQ